MLDWSDQQRARVVSALTTHPLHSNRCAEAAQAIIPSALEVDAEAHGVLIQPPLGALYVQPKDIEVRWHHHVTVAVARHCVDVLPGPEGHERNTYLATYFDYGEEHRMRPIEPHEWEGL